MCTPDASSDDTLALQERIIEQVTRDGVLAGELEGLAGRFEQTPDEFRRCLRALVAAQQIIVQTQPGGYLTVRLERRSPASDDRPRNRRRFHFDTWRL